MPDELTEEQIKKARDGYVPRDRLNEETGKLRTENAQLRESLSALESQIQALSDKSAAPDESQQLQKEFSRADLKAFVESGQITQQQADDVWDAQQEQRLERRIRQALEAERSHQQQESTVTGLKNTIQQYIDALPEIAIDSSEERQKLRNEYNRLARITGLPKKGSKQEFELQVLALDTLYGSVADVLKRNERQNHQRNDNLMADTPAQEETAKAMPQSKVLKNLSARQKAHYERGIAKGVYKDWTAVEEELSWRDKRK